MDTATNNNNRWSFSRKIIFCFFFIYFFLDIFPFPLDVFNRFEPSGIAKYYYDIWESLVFWVAEYVFHIPKDIYYGDSIFAYIQLSIKLIIALIGCIIWTFADRKRNNYDLLFYWLTVYVRYSLAITLLGYGFSKILNTQFIFIFPDLELLVSSYGEFSPMGLLWRFMGYSTSYQMFTGIIELVGGFLLLFRRTTTLGGIILIGVTCNVVMLNISYDVMVKLHSIKLLLTAVFLVAIDSKRIISFFLLNKPVAAIEINPPFVKPWINKAKHIAKLLLIISLLYSLVKYYQGIIKSFPKTPPALYGIYNIENFVKNKDTLPPLTTDTIRWRRMIVNWTEVNVQLMNDSSRKYIFKTDTVTKTIEMFSRKDTINKYFLTYTLPDTAHLVMRGKFKDDSIYIKMKKIDINTFRLVNWRTTWLRNKSTGRMRY